MELQLGDVGRIIELAVAPVFLLTGIGANLGVLTNRLGRIIDRSRILEDFLRAESANRHEHLAEITVLYRRGYLINRAITLSTACALLVCIVIASLFVGAVFRLGLNQFIAGLFILAMMSLIGSFIYFLREIFVATQTMTVLYINRKA